MPEYFAVCTECEHGWVTRKSPTEIDQPRCSECDATGHSIIFKETADAAEEWQHSEKEPELVRRAKEERRWQELRLRLNENLDRLEQTAPSDVDETVARDVYGAYQSISKLYNDINDRGPEIGLADLNAVSDYLDKLEAEIEDKAPDLESVDDLNSMRNELETEIEDLETEKEDLSSLVGNKKRKYLAYSERLEGIEDEIEIYDIGFEDAEKEFKITIPCAVCEENIQMRRGSQMHNAAIQALQGWTHRGCMQDGWSSPRVPSW